MVAYFEVGACLTFKTWRCTIDNLEIFLPVLYANNQYYSCALQCFFLRGERAVWALQYSRLGAHQVFLLTCINRFSQPSLKAELAFFFPHVSRAQRLAPARTRTRVVRLGAQCIDHWTTEQNRGVGVPAVQWTTHVKSSTLYGRTVAHPNFFSLMGYYYFV